VKLPEPVQSLEIPRGSETILLVEDDLAVQLVTQIALTRLGYRVLPASTGKEAKQLWQTHQAEIKLVLTDMVMPEGLSGSDIAGQFKKDAPDIKIIFMSGYNAEIAGTNFPQMGEDTFLGKPFEIHTLANAVRKCLDAPGSN
jgi:CheY-like chemotaxis protein